MILLLLCLLPTPDALSDRCEEIEVHHFYDCDGRKIFVQFIFWEWKNGYRVVKDWRLEKGQTPHRHGSGWRLTFMDGERLRIVDAPVKTESWGQEDRELLDRDRWPVEPMKRPP